MTVAYLWPVPAGRCSAAEIDTENYSHNNYNCIQNGSRQ